tara:strand:- start:10432 stop:10614 length:183 start_codon:yes stop_codon:yes gene_type:complete
MTVEIEVITYIENKYGSDPTDEQIIEALKHFSLLDSEGNLDDDAVLKFAEESFGDDGGAA